MSLWEKLRSFSAQRTRLKRRNVSWTICHPSVRTTQEDVVSRFDSSGCSCMRIRGKAFTPAATGKSHFCITDANNGRYCRSPLMTPGTVAARFAGHVEHMATMDANRERNVRRTCGRGIRDIRVCPFRLRHPQTPAEYDAVCGQNGRGLRQRKLRGRVLRRYRKYVPA